MITHFRLLELLSYNQTTGSLTWKKKPHENAKIVVIGSVAGWWCTSTNSYRIEIDRKTYLLHRLIWFYVYGEWPERQIDHKNGNQRDNRIVNLRLASNSQNQANMRAKSNSSTGVRGVSKRGNSYVVQLYKRVNGQEDRVWGTFKTLDEAIAFAEMKSKELHGEFSYHSRAA